ncbi:hypothetical protein CFD26_102625 [Aspergillus turcosus]|uniref:Aromatic prenyltransferase (DMATS family) n=1 Tax=Aspergillus turcosus TaxID=1245748 RepID=A0A3R7JGL1_9EURO|nr:hypothetical protein CFD26_102625 [Aspergillus turcosus]
MTVSKPNPLCQEGPETGTPTIQALSRFVEFKSDDEESWFNKTAPLLAKLLLSAGYSVDHQYEYLTFYYKFLVPALGPYPQRYSSAITRSGLPLEFSANYQEHGGSPVIRIGFEPVNALSGTARDPYNQYTVASLLGQISNLRPKGFDDRLWHYFAHEHTVSAAEREQLNGEKVHGSELKSQMAFGFDLKGGDIVVKGYSFPALKVQVSNKSFGDLMESSIRKLQDEMDCTAAFEKVNSYMHEVNGYNQFAFFSWDCVIPSASRLKFYGVHNNVTWPQIEELWTLNGRAKSSSTPKALERLKQLWDLMNIKEGTKAFAGGFDDGSGSDQQKEAPMVWNYEMKPGSALPLTKFYFPVHGENDMKIVTALSRFFEIIGLTELARSYPDSVKALFPDEDLSQTRQLVSWVSFAYTEKTGVYLSVYYHSSSDNPWSK